MQKLRRNVAGIDIGAKQIFVAVEGQSVRIFDTYTEDFLGAAEYLLENKINPTFSTYPEFSLIRSRSSCCFTL